MSEVTKEVVTEAMLALITEYFGKKKLKPMDLIKEMKAKFGDACDKKMCKEALNLW